MPKIAAPPKWMLFLLWPFKGESCYPQIEGDLSEEFQQRASNQGIAGARRWYRHEIFRSVASLIFRRATIAAMVLPFICDTVRGLFNPPLRNLVYVALKRGLSPQYFTIFMIFVWLLSKAVPALVFGMVCSVFQRGHERMVRLGFTVYYLGLWSMWLIDYLRVFARWNPLTNPETFVPLLGHTPVAGFGELEPFWILAFIWYGSTWIERSHCRQAIA